MEIPAGPPVQSPAQPVTSPVQPPAQPPIQPPVQPTTQQPLPPIQQVPQTPQSTPKSQKGLFIALVLIVITAIFGIFVYSMKKPSPTPVDNTGALPTTTQEVVPTDANKESTILPTGTNDTQLEQDIQSIDTKIGTAESELGNIEQGLNDQSVNLTE